MSGLYQRALAYIRSHRDLTLLEATAVDTEQRISPEERQKVMGEINEIVARNRIQVTPETLKFTPKQSGGVLPILINAGAAVVLIGGILAAVFLFRRQEQTIVTAPAALETAEGRLIQTLREESQRELSQKQQEINDIQNRLQRINQEKAQMQEQLDSRLQEREQELREALARELEAERGRLRNAGLSDDRIATELQELEKERIRSVENEMASFRSELQAEIEQREATLNQLTREYEENLGRAREESARLQRELASRQAELEARFREQETALRADRARALEQLESLREQQETEQLIRDQFLSFYARTREHLENRRFSEALGTLAEFRRYLDQPGVSVLPGIRKRRPVELFLIDSLEQLVEQERDSAGTDTESLIASANLISRVSEMVERADRLFQDRDYQRARELYLSAVAEIPAVKIGYDRLREIEDLFAERKTQEVAGLIAGAGSAYRRGDYETAVNGYARALTLLQGQRGAVDEMIAQIMEAGYQLRSAVMAATEAERRTEEAEGSRELAESLAAELEAARNRIVELEAALGEARERLAELEASRRRIAELESARNSAEQRVAELEAAVQQLTASEATQADLARLAAELEAARGRIRELEAARSVTQQRIDELEVAAAEVRRRSAELTAARRRIGELEREKAQAEQRVEELEAAQSAARQRIGELEKADEEAKKRLAELEAARSRIAELETAAVEARQRAAELEAARDEAQQRIGQLESAGTEADKRLAELEEERRERQAAASELQRIRRQYLALSARYEAATDGASAALVTLLETKVLIQRVLISEPVRSQYPELYDRFELYLEALVEEQERETRVAVLRDVETLLDSLIREQGPKMPVNTLQIHRTESASPPFLQVLDKLELLLR